MRVPMRISFPQGKIRALTFSYDDGVVQDKRLVEIFNKHGLKGTFNINGACYNSAPQDPTYGRMTKESAIALFKDSGHEVAIHGFTHAWLSKLDSAGIVHEITEDRRQLEADFGRIVRGMAYAYGAYNDTVINILDMCGIAYARTTTTTHNFNFPQNWLEWNPTCHHKDPKLMELAENFLAPPRNSWRAPVLFYVWGHSYEFDDMDNWNVIEEFAEFMGGREDIWYATNMEIYEYVQAYNRLVTSYDKTFVYNPSNITVWFWHQGKDYCVEPGQTITL